MPRARRNLLLALIGALTLWFAWSIRAVLNPLILGYLLAYILHPMVLKLEGPGRSRKTAVNLIFAAGFITSLLLIGGFLAESTRLGRDVFQNEQIRAEIGTKLASARDTLRERRLLPEGAMSGDPQAILDQLKALLFDEAGVDAGAAASAAQAAGKAGIRAAGGVWAFVTSIVGSVAGLLGLIFLVPLYTWFLLFELDRIHKFVRRYIPKGDRTQFSRIGRQIGEILANFFRGRLLVCVIKGLLLTVGLALADVDYAFLFGMGSGFLSLIPVVGPLIGWFFAFLVGIIQHGVLFSLVRTGLVFWTIEMIEGYILVPKVLGESLGLHPLVVLFTVIAGGAALGLFGMLVALPLTACIVILVRELVLPALARFADEERGAESG